MKPKQRLSASVDAHLLAAAETAARRGHSPTVSAWVNDAMRLKLVHDERLRALAAFIADYEAEHGEISSAEIELAARRARNRAVTVRSLAPTRRSPTPERRTGTSKRGTGSRRGAG